MKISHKEMSIILNNTLNLSSSMNYDYSLKVAYIVSEILEEKNYSKKEILKYVFISFFKDLLQPREVLTHQILDDKNQNIIDNYYIEASEILLSIPELKPYLHLINIIRYQNITKKHYEELSLTMDLPKEISTFRLAKDIVLVDCTLRDYNDIFTDRESYLQEDLVALQNIIAKKDIIANLQNRQYKELMSEKLANESFDTVAVIGIIKALTVSLDFRHEKTISHSSVLSSFCRNIGDRLFSSDYEKRILYVSSVLANCGRYMFDGDVVYDLDLTEEELKFAIKRLIVAQNEVFRRLRLLNYSQIINQQFELCNGTGLPLKLKSESINRYSKILSLGNLFCHIYETKTKNAREIVSIIKKEESFGKYDSELVKIFVDNADNFLADIDKNVLHREILYYSIKNKIKDIERKNELLKLNDNVVELIKKPSAVENILLTNKENAKLRNELESLKSKFKN